MHAHLMVSPDPRRMARPAALLFVMLTTAALGLPRPSTGQDLAQPDWPRALSLALPIDEAARRHGIDPLLLHAIAHVESRHRVQAVSPAGARGLMQVMPGTARTVGVSDASTLHDVRTNLDAASAHLKSLQAHYGNDLRLVLAAYNAGAGAVDRHGRQVPPYPETQRYVRAVLAIYGRLTAASRATAR